jgi:hypothetical protein
MPRYFFDLYNHATVLDDAGVELPDDEAMRANALREVREMLAASIECGEIDLNHRIEVRDEAGGVIHTVHFGDAVRVVPLQENRTS